jgi:anti-sigma factor ChrR (cupin superfamily)
MVEPLIIDDVLRADPSKLFFEPFREGVEACWLYRDGPQGAAAAFLRYAPGARVPHHLHGGYEHVLVISGSQTDRNGRHGKGTLVINPPGTTHEVVSEEGCMVLVIWERPVIF